MNYTFFAIAIIGCLISAFISIYVLTSNYRERLNQLFFAFSLGVVLFCLSHALMFLSPDQLVAAGTHHLTDLAWFLFLASFLHFCVILARRDTRIIGRFFVGAGYLLSLAMVFLELRYNLFYELPQLTVWGYSVLPSPNNWVMAGYSVIMVTADVWFLSLNYREAPTRREKSRGQAILNALVLGATFGFISDVIFPLIGLFYVTMIPLAISIFILLFGLAIVRYGFLSSSPEAIVNNIIETMPGALVFSDRTQHIVLVNQSFKQLTGYADSEIIGQPCTGFHVDQAAHRRLHELIDQQGKITDQRATLRTKTGGVIPVSVAGSLVKDKYDEVIGSLVIFQNIADEQKLLADQQALVIELTKNKERMLSILEDTTESRDEARSKTVELAKAVEGLKVVDKMKTEFLSVVSHELRTPLTPIKGYVSLLNNEQNGPLTPMQKKAIAVIGKEAEHLLELIDNVLDVSRLEAGHKIELNRVPVSLKVQVEKLVEVMGEQAKAEGKELVSELPPDLPTIVADQKKIVRALTNIIGNGLKFTPKGGKVKLSGRQDGDKVRIEINDNGLGLAAENLEKIFTKFYQVDTSYTRAVGGVGIGLSIAQEIVVAHGGQIWAESPGVGHGTTIVFTLPIS